MPSSSPLHHPDEDAWPAMRTPSPGHVRRESLQWASRTCSAPSDAGRPEVHQGHRKGTNRPGGLLVRSVQWMSSWSSFPKTLAEGDFPNMSGWIHTSSKRPSLAQNGTGVVQAYVALDPPESPSFHWPDVAGGLVTRHGGHRFCSEKLRPHDFCFGGGDAGFYLLGTLHITVRSELLSCPMGISICDNRLGPAPPKALVRSVDGTSIKMQKCRR